MMLRSLALLAGILSASAATGAEPTAVFTYDTATASFFVEEVEDLRDAFYGWAQRCRSVASGDVIRLDCPPTPPARVADGTDTVEARVTVGLFRDLDETVYIAACPLLSEKETPDPRAPKLEEIVESEDWKSCLDLARGQTFSAEVESREARLVMDGRQLPLRIFAKILKDRRIDSPYLPRKSRPLPRVSVGPGTAAPEALSGPEPSLPLPDIDRLSAGQPSASQSARKSAKPMGNATTDLPTGRLMISCESSKARVFIDRAHVGACPFDSSVVAGRHSVRVEQPDREPFESEVTVVAGKTHEEKVPE